jgi:CubicO group peptidase (beta-lactamase class C family)
MVRFGNDDPEFLSIAKGIQVNKEIKLKILDAISRTPVGKPGNYVYSDIDFILLGMIVERISGLSLDKYAENNFYKPLGIKFTGFKPLARYPSTAIMPTQYDSAFRKQLLHGYVHDPAAAMMGGVAGHAGLFGTAYDFYVLMQMLLQNGSYGGRSYLKPKTVKNFTSYGSKSSRRGLGFDKSEKDNNSRQDAYPAKQASTLAFGHTGFTGTCAWADPSKGIVYIFLSNRIYPSGSSMLNTLKVRKKVHEAIYRYF